MNPTFGLELHWHCLKFWPLIGREVPQKFFKGGTITILNLCQSNTIDLNWHWIGSSQVWLNGRFPLQREAND